MPAKPKANTQGKKKPPEPRLKYSDELADRMCSEIAIGRSVKDVCDNEDWSCSESSFYLWMMQNDYFAEKYTRAKEAAQEVEAEKMRQIADEATPETVNVARLQIDTRKWIAARQAPKKYGDRQTVDMNMNDMDRDDKELLHELRQSAARLGIPVDGLLKGMKIDE